MTCRSPDKACGTSRQEGGCSIFAGEEPRTFSEEQEKCKRQIYEQMNPRRRKFVDRLGYENWDPFQAPNDPLDIRKDPTNRTLDELVSEFMRDCADAEKSRAWRKGAAECALGIMRQDEKYQGIFDFCVWYGALLEKEGRKNERKV